ncbi:MAG: LCP family protein [Erysipelotrichales bacterium]
MRKHLTKIVVIEMIIVAALTIAHLFKIFPTLKYAIIMKIAIISLLLIIAIIVIGSLFQSFFNKKWKVVITVLIFLIYNGVLGYANKFLYEVDNSLQGIDTLKTSLVAKSDSKYNSEDDIDNSAKIGVQTSSNEANGEFAMAEVKKMDKTKNIKQYTNYKNALAALEKGEVDMISMTGIRDREISKLDSSFADNHKVVASFKGKLEHSKSDKDITKVPFTILVSGIDSRSSNIKDVSNSDSNILVTFNPDTGKVTTLTTPRDSFVPIQCNNYSNDKLTHAGAYGGTKCVQKTLEKLYDVKVDYTVRINFTGVIDIVDALGGVEVDVPENKLVQKESDGKTCEQNSHGKKGTLCWYDGKVNKFNGEEALAFARNRYGQDGGDFYRGRNQQIVIESIIHKATSINNIETVSKLLASVSDNMKTNLSRNDIISLYEVMIGLDTGLNIEKLYISGSTGMENGLSVVYPSQEDVDYASYRMKANLELLETQFPGNDYYVEGTKPENIDGNNALRKQKAAYKKSKEKITIPKKD